MAKSKKEPKKEAQYFVLAGALNGTTGAVIKTTSLKKAYIIYCNSVVIPVRQKIHFDKSCVKGNIYFDGNIYAQKLKRYKKIKKHMVACLDGNLKLEGVFGFAESD